MNPLGSKLTKDSSSTSTSSQVASIGEHAVICSSCSPANSRISQLFDRARPQPFAIASFSQVDEHLSPTLFAHIHMNDKGLVGTGLEGHVFSTSIDYASKELSRVSSGEYQIGLKPEELEQVKNLQGELNSSKQLLERLYQINALPPEEATKALALIQSELMKQVANLKPGERILLPGGWTGAPGGHAMLYEIEKRGDGNLSFHLYNSGDGLQYHPSRPHAEDSSASKYLCHLEWNLGSLTDSQTALNTLLPQLLRLRACGKSPRAEDGCQQLYKEILPSFEKMGARRQIPLPGDPSWMNAQRAGVCTWQSIQVLERARLPGIQKRLNLCTKVRSYRDFIRSTPMQKHPEAIGLVARFAFKQLGNKLQACGLSRDLISAPRNSFGSTFVSTPELVLGSGFAHSSAAVSSQGQSMLEADPRTIQKIPESLQNRVHRYDEPARFIDFMQYTNIKTSKEQKKVAHDASFLHTLASDAWNLIRSLLKDLAKPYEDITINRR